MKPQPATFARLIAKGNDRPRADQAWLCLLLPALLLSACDVPGQINLRLIGRDISGAAGESRLPPPGIDRPFANLASVPPIPERPDLAARLALTTSLQAQRDLLNQPLPPGRPDSPLTEDASPGQPSIAAAPPRPASLARAAVIPWTTQTAPAPIRPAVQERAPENTPGAPPRLIPPQPVGPEQITPGAVPDLPSADLLAPAPPPPRLR